MTKMKSENKCKRCVNGIIIMSDWERSEAICPDCNGTGKIKEGDEDHETQ